MIQVYLIKWTHYMNTIYLFFMLVVSLLTSLTSALLVGPTSINMPNYRILTCWITFTKSLRALRLDRVMMTAVARYRKM
jgi:hypothetical protein